MGCVIVASSRARAADVIRGRVELVLFGGATTRREARVRGVRAVRRRANLLGTGWGLDGSQASRLHEWALFVGSDVVDEGRSDGRRAWIGREGEGPRGAHPRREVAASRWWRHGRSAPRLRTTRPPDRCVLRQPPPLGEERSVEPVPSSRTGLDWQLSGISQTRNKRSNKRSLCALFPSESSEVWDGIPRRGASMSKQ